MYQFKVLAVVNNQSASAPLDTKQYLKRVTLKSSLFEKFQVDETGKTIVSEDPRRQYSLSIDELQVFGLKDMTDRAFILSFESKDENQMNHNRTHLLKAYKELGFDEIHIIEDTLSSKLSIEIHPMISECENLLRRYITIFFVREYGSGWLVKATDSKIRDTSKTDRNSTEFNDYIVTNLFNISFGDLGSLLIDTRANTMDKKRFESLVDELEKSSLDRKGIIQRLKREKKDIGTNFERFFSKYFDNRFREDWQKLTKIRNLVAHNHLCTLDDLRGAKSLSEKIKRAITGGIEEVLNSSERLMSEDESMMQKDKYSEMNTKSSDPLDNDQDIDDQEIDFLEGSDSDQDIDFSESSGEDKVSALPVKFSDLNESKDFVKDRILRELRRTEQYSRENPGKLSYIGKERFLATRLKRFDREKVLDMLDELIEEGKIQRYYHRTVESLRTVRESSSEDS